MTDALARVTGQALGGFFGAVAAVRRKKPLHPRGSVVAATLERWGSPGAWGVPWLDEAGQDSCRVRFSRSVGLPAPWPDVLGLAVQFRDATGEHDLLLASSAAAPVLRHLLLPRSNPLTARYGSVFTYSTPRGPVVLGATPFDAAAGGFPLVVARPRGSWQGWGFLRLHEDPTYSPDAALDLDPVLHPLPGLALSGPLAALREPSYAAARRARPR